MPPAQRTTQADRASSKRLLGSLPGTPETLKDDRDAPREDGELILHNGPNELGLHPHVVVDDLVAHPRDSSPRNLGISLADFGGKVLDRFANNLDASHYRILELLIFDKVDERRVLDIGLRQSDVTLSRMCVRYKAGSRSFKAGGLRR